MAATCPSRAPTRSGWPGTAQGAPGGHSGKRDNCQAGVYLGYASGHGDTLLDRRLYLPACWFSEDYADRWRACGIPRGTPFQTKHELAATLVEEAMAAGTLRARWVVCDAGYGDSPALLDRWAATGLHYLAEVPCATQGWCLTAPDGQTPQPAPQAWVPPQAASKNGPAPRRARLHPDSAPKARADTWAAQVPPDRWRRYRVLEGSKGPLVADFVAVRWVTVRERLPGPEAWLLVRRSVPADPTEAPAYKYYTSNAPADTPLPTLVWVRGMRWPIEACFAEARQEVGLDHDETRSWPGHRVPAAAGDAGRAPPPDARPPRAPFPGATPTPARPESGACGPVLLPPTATVSQLTQLLPPAPLALSLAQVRVLLRACLPLPALDLALALALITYHQRHKRAAYQAHRRRRLRSLSDP